MIIAFFSSFTRKFDFVCLQRQGEARGKRKDSKSMKMILIACYMCALDGWEKRENGMQIT